MEQNQQAKHVFGESDFLSANDYEVGQEVQIKFGSFKGRPEYKSSDGTTKVAALFLAKAEKDYKDFRFGIKNEKIAKSLGINGYDELEGKTGIFKVKHFNIGNGFVLQGFVNEQHNRTIPKTPQSAPVRKPLEGPATEPQLKTIKEVYESGNALSDIIRQYLEDQSTSTGKVVTIDGLSKQQASDLITELRNPHEGH